MTLLTKLFKSRRACFCKQQNPFNFLLRGYCKSGEDVVPEDVPEDVVPEEKEEFRVLKILPPPQVKRAKDMRDAPVPRTPDVELGENADWTNIWVGPKTFDPYIFPVPMRQGYRHKGAPPDKYGNAELMKIPNFLHLTPVAIKKHCEALKQFCTEWPKELSTEDEMEEHFPVTIIYSDYCNSLPTIRDPLSRIMTLKIKLNCLKFDKHAKDKFLRLVGQRYDPDTDCVTLTTENCPTKKQNYDYVMYLLTALYFESWKVENWESLKTAEDQEEYIFSERLSKRKIDDYFAYNKMEVPDTSEIGKITETMLNEEESLDVVESYKEAVVDLVGLPRFR